jgi:urease accessory protein
MRAAARIVAEADGRGHTRLTVLHGEAPLLLRRTGGPDVTVHLVGGAAGPLGGDELRLDVEVGPGARLRVRSVAASLALPGRTGGASGMSVRVSVAGGAVLDWHPEPLIAAAGCDHHVRTEVDVASGGTLRWRDDLVCGRHGETAGDVRIDTAIRYAGRTLYRHQLAVGPTATGWSGPAVLGGGRAVGSLVVVDPGWDVDGPPGPRVLGPDAALMPLVGPAVLATAVGADIRPVRAHLDPLAAGVSAAPLPALA